MPFVNGSERQLAYVAETTFGVTPSTPSFKLLRITGGGLRARKGTVISDEIRPDRNVSDVLMTSQDVEGEVNFELTADTFDDMLAATFRGAWASNVLKNGILKPSFTFEERAPIGVGSTFSRYLGAVPNTLSLNIPSRGLITGSLGFMARQETLAAAILAGATYAAATTTQPMNSSSNVSSLTVTGATTPYRLKSLELRVTNNLRIRDEVGSLYSNEFGAGRFELTGTAGLYFEGNDQYQAFLDHAAAGLSFTVGVEGNKKYTIALPKIRLNDVTPDRGNNNSDFMLQSPFQAVFDSASAATATITRAVA